MFFIKKMIKKSKDKRFEKFLNEYKSFSDELLWDYYCGLDMDIICEGTNEYNSKMYSLVEEELEKRNNKKYPVRGW